MRTNTDTLRDMLDTLLRDLDHHAEKEGEQLGMRTSRGWETVRDRVAILRRAMDAYPEPEDITVEDAPTETAAPLDLPIVRDTHGIDPGDIPFIDPASALIDALNTRFPGHTFRAMKGRKYTRIVKADRGTLSESAHAFMDETGNLYKADGWKRPCATPKYRVSTPNLLNNLITSLNDQDWAGGYLYTRI